MGQEKRTLGGFSSRATAPNCGLMHFCDVVQAAAPYLRAKAVKVVAGKVALAARCDHYGQNPNGDVGRRYRSELEEKIEKWMEPQQAKTKKALPKPDDMPARKRGGKR
ncbi:unnamed protein product, partial [Discosporangium mesarthrocarpum]